MVPPKMKNVEINPYCHYQWRSFSEIKEAGKFIKPSCDNVSLHYGTSTWVFNFADPENLIEVGKLESTDTFTSSETYLNTGFYNAYNFVDEDDDEKK